MLKSALVFSVCLLSFTACKKQDNAKTPPVAAVGSGSASGSAAGSSAPAELAGSAAGMATGSATGSAAATVTAPVGAATDAELEATALRVSQLMDTVTDIAKATTPDCPTMATQLEELFQKNAALLSEIKSLDTRMTQAQKDTLGEKMNPATKRFQTIFPDAFKPCSQDNDSSVRIMKLFNSLK
ncbi:MAG: hypothetical protein KBG15_04485 [Kofleriaceae bacterium]|nr:hypothetical protein [Kofleriaceae bacterium]